MSIWYTIISNLFLYQCGSVPNEQQITNAFLHLLIVWAKIGLSVIHWAGRWLLKNTTRVVERKGNFKHERREESRKRNKRNTRTRVTKYILCCFFFELSSLVDDKTIQLWSSQINVSFLLTRSEGFNINIM